MTIEILGVLKRAVRGTTQRPHHSVLGRLLNRPRERSNHLKKMTARSLNCGLLQLRVVGRVEGATRDLLQTAEIDFVSLGELPDVVEKVDCGGDEV